MSECEKLGYSMVQKNQVHRCFFLTLIDYFKSQKTIEKDKRVFFLNDQQHKVGISGNHFFVSFVTFFEVTHMFTGKCYLIF